MDTELEVAPGKKYQHLWILLLLPALYFLSNQDKIRFGYLSRHLFGEKLGIQSIDKNVRVEDIYLLNTDNFNEIVRGGKRYLPFIILKLQIDKKFVWSELMQGITGVDINQYARDRRWVGTDEDPDLLWLKWWQENQGQYR